MTNICISVPADRGEGWRGGGAPRLRAAWRAQPGRSRDRTPPLLECLVIVKEMHI